MSIAIIARVFMSWLRVGTSRSGGRISQMIIDVTQPVINIAKKIPHKIGMIDFSPIIALIALDILELIIISLLTRV